MSTPDPLKTLSAIETTVKADTAVTEAAVLSFRAKAVAYVQANAGKIVTGVMILAALALWKFL